MKKNILKVILNRIAAEAESPGDEGINEQLEALRPIPSEGLTSIIRDVTRVPPPQDGQPCCELGCCKIIYSSLKTVSYADVQDQITPIFGLMAGAHGMPPNTPFLPDTLTITQTKSACVSTTKEGCNKLKELRQIGGGNIQGFVSGRACLLKQTIDQVAWKNKSCQSINCLGNYSPISLYASNPFNGRGGHIQLPKTYHEVYHFSEQEYNTFLSQAIMATINNCMPLTAQQATDLSDAIQWENSIQDATYFTVMSGAYLLLGSAGLIYRTATGACAATPQSPFFANTAKEKLRMAFDLILDASGAAYVLYEPEIAKVNFRMLMPAQWSDEENLSNLPFCFIPPNTLDEDTGHIYNTELPSDGVSQNQD